MANPIYARLQATETRDPGGDHESSRRHVYQVGLAAPVRLLLGTCFRQVAGFD